LAGVDWIDMTHVKDKWRALMTAAFNFQFTWNAGKLPNRYTPDGLSSSHLHRRTLVLLVFIVMFVRFEVSRR
jgi:hypothetical protein